MITTRVHDCRPRRYIIAEICREREGVARPPTTQRGKSERLSPVFCIGYATRCMDGTRRSPSSGPAVCPVVARRRAHFGSTNRRAPTGLIQQNQSATWRRWPHPIGWPSPLRPPAAEHGKQPGATRGVGAGLGDVAPRHPALEKHRSGGTSTARLCRPRRRTATSITTTSRPSLLPAVASPFPRCCGWYFFDSRLSRTAAFRDATLPQQTPCDSS